MGLTPTDLRFLKRIKSGVPTELAELAQLGRSLWKRREEILAYFDTGASNGSCGGDRACAGSGCGPCRGKVTCRTVCRSRQRRRPNAGSTCGRVDRIDVDARQMRKKYT